jgi:hypothetical protein
MMAFGTLEPLGELAALNKLAVTASPPPGTLLLLPDAEADKKVLRAFRDYSVVVAVAVSQLPEDTDGYFEDDYFEDDYI